MVDTPTLWEGLSQVNTSEDLAQIADQIVALPDGGYVIVWTDLSGNFSSGSAIVGQRFNTLGEKIGGEVLLSSFTVGNASSASATLLADGTIGVAFTHSDDIFVRRYDTNLDLVQGDTIELAGTNARPSVAAFANGSYLVTYTVGTGADTDIVGRIVSANGVVGSQFDINNQTDNSDRSECATLSNGNVVVVLQDELNGGLNDIKFAIVTVTGAIALGPQGVVGGFDADDETDPGVAALKGGGFVVVWTDAAAANEDIRASVYDNAGNILNSNILVNTTTIGNQNEADVVALADGSFLVTWEDDTANFIRAQRFDALGNKIGTEFTVNDEVSTNSPDAALLADGRVAYALGEADASGVGVFTSIWDPRTSPIIGTNAGETLTSRNDGATVLGLGGNDTLLGRASDDTLNGGDGNDTLLGEAGNDTLLGGNGDDILFGYLGNDILNGGRGKDLLVGNFGEDTFEFNSTRDSRKGALSDTIFDFSSGQDHIDLSGIDAKKGSGNQAFKFIGQQAFHHKAGELRFKVDVAKGFAIIQGDTNGDGKADFEIKVNAVSTLTADDFVL